LLLLRGLCWLSSICKQLQLQRQQAAEVVGVSAATAVAMHSMIGSGMEFGKHFDCVLCMMVHVIGFFGAAWREQQAGLSFSSTGQLAQLS
jgi:hypothetical protein